MDAGSKTREAPLVVERSFDAPVALVWKALTEPDSIRQWSFDMKGFAPKVGTEFEFTGGDPKGVKYLHHCRVTEVIPEKKLAYTWRYEGHPGDSLVSFELFPEGGKTRLKLTHEGLETFPKLPAFERKNFMAGWTEIVGTNLKNFVEGIAKGAGHGR
jgi:uncharacterized protein YndB with AHSA1/START domain